MMTKMMIYSLLTVAVESVTDKLSDCAEHLKLVNVCHENSWHIIFCAESCAKKDETKIQPITAPSTECLCNGNRQNGHGECQTYDKAGTGNLFCYVNPTSSCTQKQTSSREGWFYSSEPCAQTLHSLRDPTPSKVPHTDPVPSTVGHSPTILNQGNQAPSNNGSLPTVSAAAGEDEWPQPVDGDVDGRPFEDPTRELENVPTQCGIPSVAPRGYYSPDTATCLTDGQGNQAPSTCGDCKKQTSDSHWVFPFLDEINKHRCMHNAAPVRWNKKLECWAAKWVMNYRSHPERFGRGEHSCGGFKDMSTNEVCGQGDNTARDLVKGWYKEVVDCYHGGVFHRTRIYEFGGKREVQKTVCGHALALLWKHQTHVGCHKQGKPVSMFDPSYASYNVYDSEGTCEFVSGEIPQEKRWRGLDDVSGLLGYGGDSREWEASLVYEKDLVEVKPTRNESQCGNGKWKNYSYDKMEARPDMFEEDVPGNYGGNYVPRSIRR